jgi:hypothetical protein
VKGKVLSDEMSARHEKTSYLFTYVVVTAILTLGVIVFGVLNIKVEINSSMFISVSMLLETARTGWYLKLEREGMSDDDVED